MKRKQLGHAGGGSMILIPVCSGLKDYLHSSHTDGETEAGCREGVWHVVRQWQSWGKDLRAPICRLVLLQKGWKSGESHLSLNLPVTYPIGHLGSFCCRVDWLHTAAFSAVQSLSLLQWGSPPFAASAWALGETSWATAETDAQLLLPSPCMRRGLHSDLQSIATF